MSPQLRRTFKYHFNPDGSRGLVIYGSETCGYCTQARRQLDSMHATYTYWDVEHDVAAMQRFQTLEETGYPLIYTGRRRLGGYNARELREIGKEFE